MAKRKSIEESYSEIIGELNKKIYKPIYYLAGDEYYYIDLITDYIAENVLSESEKAFNQVVLYGRDVTIPALIDVARRFPMMSNYQVVIVKEAQVIKNIDELEIYLNAPQKTTILVLNYKLAPGASLTAKAKKIFDLSVKAGAALEFKRLYDNQVPVWITTYLKSKGIDIAPAPAELLRDYLGNDLSKIVNELEKLIVTLPTETKRITPEHIERNIGISKDYNRFELNKAIAQRDVLKANRIVNYFASNPAANPIQAKIVSLYQYFRKIFTYHFIQDKSERNVSLQLGVNPFFIAEYRQAARLFTKQKCMQVFALLREYDMRSKGWNNESVDQGELLRELVFKIIH
ncbi:MAG: DNA polymerase III subunit delta [Tenuifilaceae bacterium]